MNHYKKGNEFSLLIGAPNSENGGAIHFATVDKYDSTKTYLVNVSKSLFKIFITLEYTLDRLQRWKWIWRVSDAKNESNTRNRKSFTWLRHESG